MKFLSFCDWIPPQLVHNGKLPGLKFSKPIRIRHSFTQNFSRKALSFEFIYCLAVQQIYRISFGYWCLLEFFMLFEIFKFFFFFMFFEFPMTFKIQSKIYVSICRREMSTFKSLSFKFGFNLLWIWIQIQIQSKLFFVFFLNNFKMQDFLTDISLLIVFLFEKQINKFF